MSPSEAMERWMDHQPGESAGEAGWSAAGGGESGNVVEMPARRESAHANIRERFDAEAMPHIDDLFRTATRVMGDRARAEDVVQEAFLQAWKSFDRFEPGTNCRAWLFRILFHCIHHHRRRWFRFPLLKEKEEFLEANLAAPSPVPDKLTDAEILAALDRISDDFRSVVLLVDVEEFAYKEVADILKIPIGTVMSRLSRGRRALRDQLAAVAESYGILRGAQKGQTA
jgi:RNA polymerase sigma-70 factor (ECF subfamily)